ncbi:hypothetical protein EON63_12480 [archaeon]|nr:MAG: hypothetical protein EON63_12480 [archaeon]
MESGNIWESGYLGIWESGDLALAPMSEAAARKDHNLRFLLDRFSLLLLQLGIMVASAVFIMDTKGKVIIARNYRGDIPMSVAERFAHPPTLSCILFH